MANFIQKLRDAVYQYGINNPKSADRILKVDDFLANRARVNTLSNAASKIQSPVLRIPAQMASAVVEAPINAPSRLYRGSTQFGSNIGEMMRGEQKWNPRELLANAGEFGEGALDAVTAPFLVGSAAKSIGKESIKQMLKRTALEGAKYGASYGAVTGLQRNKDLSGSNYATNLTKDILTGGVTGAVMAPATSLLVKGVGKAAESISSERADYEKFLAKNPEQAARVSKQKGFIRLGSSPDDLKFSEPYKRGDISQIQSKIDDLLGIGQGTGKNHFIDRINARKELAYGAETSPEVALIQRQVASLEDELANAQASRPVKETKSVQTEVETVFNAEPSQKTMKSILSRRPVSPRTPFEVQKQGIATKEYEAWVKSLQKEYGTKNKLNYQLDKLGNIVETQTNKGIAERLATTKSGKPITGRGGITVDKKLIDRSNTWSDRKTFATLRNNYSTPRRVIEATTGGDKDMMNLVDEVQKSDGDIGRMKNKVKTEVKTFGVKRNSTDSALAQRYGEGTLTLEQLQQLTPNWEKVKNLTEYTRGLYDELLTAWNNTRKRNGLDPIPRREDYMRHVPELADALASFGVDAPIEAFTVRPNTTFSTAQLQRKGSNTKIDAVSNLINYIDSVLPAIYQTDNISKIRTLSKAITEAHGETGHLGNFNRFLQKWADRIGGSETKMDTGFKDEFGTGLPNLLNSATKRFTKNVIGGNLTAPISNFVSAVQATGLMNPKNLASGFSDSFVSMRKGWTREMEKSNFLSDRLFGNKVDVGTKVNKNVKDILTTGMSVAADASMKPFNLSDEFTSLAIWNGSLREAKAKGLVGDSAIKFADDLAARIMGDRSRGGMALSFGNKNPVSMVLNKFQLEVVNNFENIFHDIPRKAGSPKEVAKKLGTMFITGYLFNNVYSQITGRDIAIDPIGLVMDTYKDIANPDMKQEQKVKNAMERIANQLPFSSIFSGGRLPVASSLPDIGAVATASPDAMGRTATKEFTKFGANILMPFGGSQVNKTSKGMTDLLRGYSQTGASVQTPVAQSPQNLMRAVLAGPSAFPEVTQYYDEGRKPLQDTQNETFKELVKTDKEAALSYYEDIIRNRTNSANENKLIEEAKNGIVKLPGDTTYVVPPSGQTLTIDDIIAKKQATEDKRRDISSILNGKYDERTKQALIQMKGITTTDIQDWKTSQLRNADDKDVALFIGNQDTPDLVKLYGDKVLTSSVAKEMQRLGLIKDADSLMEKLKMTDVYYQEEALKDAQKKYAKATLKNKSSVTKKILSAQKSSINKMLKSKAKKAINIKGFNVKLNTSSIKAPPKATKYKVKLSNKLSV